MILSLFIKITCLIMMGNCASKEKVADKAEDVSSSDSESFSSLSPMSLIKPVAVRKQEQKEQNIRDIFTKEYRNQRFSVKKNSSH